MASNDDHQIRSEEKKGEAEQEVLIYDNYIRITSMLTSQVPLSSETTEILFIIVHQVSELWFKQLLLDIDSVRSLMQHKNPDENLASVVTSLKRIVLILKIINQHFEVLETMSPMDYLEFRDALNSSSAFQSTQFRLIEIKLGVLEEKRLQKGGKHYSEYLSEEGKRKVKEALAEPTVLDLVEKWLEKTPVMNDKLQFVTKYREHVKQWMEKTNRVYQDSGFERVLDWQQYQESLDRGGRRLSHSAFLGAMVTNLYQREPCLQQRFSVLQLLMDVDKAVETWRVNHVNMVRREIGLKHGTALVTSSVAGYLTETLRMNRTGVFADLFNVSTYLIPGCFVPPLI